MLLCSSGSQSARVPSQQVPRSPGAAGPQSARARHLQYGHSPSNLSRSTQNPLPSRLLPNNRYPSKTKEAGSGSGCSSPRGLMMVGGGMVAAN